MHALKPSDFEDRMRIDKIIPINIEPTRDGSLLFRKIVDHSLNNWLNDPAVKNSAMGRTAHNVQDTMKADMSIRSSEPNGVDHRFRLTYLAFQNIAKLDYSGYLNASMRYSPLFQKTEFEILKQLEQNKELVIDRSFDPIESSSHVSLRWRY